MEVGAMGEETAGQRVVPSLQFSVLGPVRVWLDGQPLAAGTPQQRAMLAALLLRRGRTATANDLVGALWGEEPPQKAVQTLRTYATRLRRAFGPRADALVTEAGGYALRLVRGDRLDAEHSEQLVAEAEKLTSAGDLSRAHELYGAALELWNGDEALAGIPGPAAELHRDRLGDKRIVLIEQRLDVGLQLGLHADSVSELTALTTAHPFRERLREQLMLALYRSGRQAEALAVYKDARRVLVAELGVEPGPALAELHQKILNADESLNLAGPPPATVGAPPPIRPAQLPAAVPDFTGRIAFVSELGKELATAGGRVMAVSAVAGIGGVGKTTLAVQVAHAAREHFPDGQLYVDLQGAGPEPAEPQAVLGSFLRTLGMPDSSIPEGVAERSALYRSLLDGRRILALLDNARDAAQVRPLLPGTAGCATLITSRQRMVDLAGAHLVDLDVMSREEALTLFTRIVGAERVSAEQQSAMVVVSLCGFLPLAIRIAASRLASRRTWTVAALAQKLSDERHRLDELQAGDQAVKATFELGYSQLSSEQARAFRLLGLADGQDISLPAAAALLDRDAETAEVLLESLVDASLLESAAPGRYRFHDLVRLFAKACAERAEYPSSARHAALSRLLDFYLATTAAVYALQRPGDRRVNHLQPTTHPGLAFDSPAAAVDWLFTEADCLLSCAQHATDAERLRKAADLLLVALDLSESGAFSLQYERACTAVLEAAEAAEDCLAEGRVRIALSQAEHMADRLDLSYEHGRRALLLGVAAEDPIARSHGANSCGIIALYQNRHEDAIAYLTRALEEFRGDGDLPGEASVLSCLSRVNLNLDHASEAVALAEESLGILRRVGSPLRLANGQYTLGMALAANGQYAAAVAQLNDALTGFQSNRQRLWEGLTLFRLAEVHLATDQATEAAPMAEQALARLRDTGGPSWRANVLTVLGRALDDTGHTGRARACWEQALEILDSNGSPEAADVRNLLASVTV
ncbi:BTAD domain-containing putative transcriptional regulator [Streptomyces sp. 4N509B]|uniref:BTAD domain-containing putative transcriptional regulator n=1 Tax=Streptomyces sp. 4N509B TaxID=3457413 RepID=UPI003FD4FB87